MDESERAANERRYAWPRFAIAAVIAAILLAILWMTFAVLRLRASRIPDSGPANSTQPASTNTNRADGPASLQNRLAPFEDTLTGGDAVIGRALFYEKPEANCAKCHRVGAQGGETGPALDGIGSRLTREEILESLLLPNTRIPDGYETVIVLLKNGSGCSGFLKNENESELAILTGEDGLVTVKKSEIQVRQKGLSPMPEGLEQLLSHEDLRHLIAFVASLKAPEAKGR